MQSSYYVSTDNNVSTIISLFICIFTIACWYKIFRKADEDGWKAIIPIYSTYISYKLFLSAKLFVVRLIAILFNVITFFYLFFNIIFTSILVSNNANMNAQQLGRIGLEILMKNSILCAVMLILCLVIMVIDIMFKYYTLKSFGKGGLWILLFIFFEIFVTAYLAFGNTYYEGNKYIKY